MYSMPAHAGTPPPSKNTLRSSIRGLRDGARGVVAHEPVDERHARAVRQQLVDRASSSRPSRRCRSRRPCCCRRTRTSSKRTRRAPSARPAPTRLISGSCGSLTPSQRCVRQAAALVRGVQQQPAQPELLRARGAERVADQRLRRAARRRCAEYSRDDAALHLVILLRGGAVQVDVADAGGLQRRLARARRGSRLLRRVLRDRARTCGSRRTIRRRRRGARRRRARHEEHARAFADVQAFAIAR